MVDVNKDGQLNGRAVVEADFAGTSPPTFEAAAHSKPPVPVTVLSAEDAYARVLAEAGTCQHRDAVELRLVAQLASLGKTGAVMDPNSGNESDVGGQPAVTSEKRAAGFDTDGDGIPDTWETAHGLNPNSASDGTGDYNGDGYTNVEKYLNELADLACPGGASPTQSDAGIPKPADAATPGVEAGPPPGRDAGSPTGPDAAISGNDAPTLRPDGGTPGSDAPVPSPDAGSPGSDAPVPSPDAGSPSSDVTATRPDLAVVASDAAVSPVDTAMSMPALDTAPTAADGPVPVTADAPAQASTGPDAAGSDSGSTTGPAATASGCTCSTGSGRSRDHLGFLPLAVGLLFVVRGWSLRRHRRPQ
jgi:hypothetical protein